MTELLQKVNFQGDLSSVQEKSDFLMKKLREINSTITDKTVWAWLSGEYRPKIEPHSRPQMYEICFALNLNLEQVQCFFNHVYFDRTFNCQIISEVFYYYAFLKNLNYFEANKIISDIETAPIEKISDSGSVYTQL